MPSHAPASAFVRFVIVMVTLLALVKFLPRASGAELIAGGPAECARALHLAVLDAHAICAPRSR